MPQQINLLDATFRRRHEPFGSTAGLVAMAGTVVLSAALTWGLHAMRAQATARAAGAETELAALQARVAGLEPAAPSRQSHELARLRSIESGQRRILAALDSGQAGEAQHYSEYLLALSRQAPGTLWLTGFSVAADGRALEVNGRMTDPRQLPEYLRRLNAEPLFKGREFAQLSMKTVEPVLPPNEVPRTGPGHTEFVLRAIATATQPP